MTIIEIAKILESEAMRNRAKADLGGNFAKDYRKTEIALSLSAAFFRSLDEKTEEMHDENRTKLVSISRGRKGK